MDPSDAAARQRRDEVTQATRLQLARLVQEAADLALESLPEVRPEPRMRLQLERVGRLVERDPGPEVVDRDAQGAGRRRGCSPPRTAAVRAPPPRTAARCRTGRAPACRGSPAGSRPGGWPGTGWPSSRRPSASSRSGAVRVAASRWSTRSRKTVALARAQPARSTTSWRSTTPGSGAAESLLQQGHDAAHGPCVRGRHAGELRGRQAAGCRAQAPGGDGMRGLPVDDAVTGGARAPLRQVPGRQAGAHGHPHRHRLGQPGPAEHALHACHLARHRGAPAVATGMASRTATPSATRRTSGAGRRTDGRSRHGTCPRHRWSAADGARRGRRAPPARPPRAGPPARPRWPPPGR